jgi:pyruvate formate lyase activating enzyme
MVVNGKPVSVGTDVTVGYVMETVERDMAYYRRSGGGLTLSGGEVLRQPEFARELLQAAKKKGIHTGIESTAMAEYGKIETLLPYLDEFLLDIKHTNPAKHKEFTGRRNELAMENAVKLAASGQATLIIRVPVIPGFNATDEEIGDIARFAGGLGGAKELHLLQYHRFGEGKYASLGREYTMGDAKPPEDAVMERFKVIAENVSGLRCQIGG